MVGLPNSVLPDGLAARRIARTCAGAAGRSPIASRTTTCRSEARLAPARCKFDGDRAGHFELLDERFLLERKGRAGGHRFCREAAAQPTAECDGFRLDAAPFRPEENGEFVPRISGRMAREGD